jgi:dihydrofolate synthase/folylpolyglutamate synthase
MEYPRALDYLKEAETRGIRPGLENTRVILDHLPRPAGDIPYIQVAGTNGKGSTAHFLTSILQAAGHRVGLFTSPHLTDVRERITIDKQWIPAEEFAHSLETVKNISENLLEKGTIQYLPTYFELVFLIAIDYFSRQKPGIAILEVGLGGRLDATTAIDTQVSIITNISHDHTAMLGTRITDIAREKAGIIKKGVPIVCGCTIGGAAHRVIKEIARQKEAPFFNVIDAKNYLDVVHRDNAYRCTYTSDAEAHAFDVHLNGAHQVFNAAAAVKTLRVLCRHTGTHVRLTPQAIRTGISNNMVPGRIEILQTSPKVILDSSHNADSTAALASFLKETNKKNLTLVFGVLADKNYRKMITLLRPHIENVILTQPQSERALPAAKIAALFKTRGSPKTLPAVVMENNYTDAYNAARRFKKDILVTGSFYLVGAMRETVINHTPKIGESHG